MLNTNHWKAVGLSLILAGLPLWAAEGRIAKAVLGTNSTENHETVNASDEFEPDTEQIVCVWKAEGVEPGSHVRSVWIAEDTRGAAPANYKILESTVIATTAAKEFNKSGTFTATRPTKGWPIGRYRVEIYLEDQLAATVPFTIRGNPASAPVPRIRAAELGTGRTADRRIANPGTVFPPDTAHIVCFWKSEGIRPGMHVRGLWLSEGAGPEPHNSTVVDTTGIADASFDGGERAGTFTVDRPAKGWPPGRYRLEIYLDARLAKTVPFTIERGE